MSLPLQIEVVDQDDIALKSYTQAEHRSESANYNPKQKCFRIYWRDLKYTVFRGLVDQTISKVLGHNVPKSRMVLKGVSGSFVAGQITALMGPSGAGKTTLLECLIGRRQTGLSGVMSCRDHDKLKMAIIPQNEKFFNVLSVRETLMYASRLQNATQDMELRQAGHCPPSRDERFHERIVNAILQKLDLSGCAENLVMACSGSQQKRLSIGQELVSNPNLLVLDEPTTGLDSVAAFTVCEHLLKLSMSEPKIAVVMTIHQPSQRIFYLFHKIYMLSNVTGTCVFEGPPRDVIAHLANFDYRCPQQYSPSDYLTEVAAGVHGEDGLKGLSAFQDERVGAELEPLMKGGASLDKLLRDGKFPFVPHVWLLLCRCGKLLMRDPMLIWSQVLAFLFLALFMWSVLGDYGKTGGCPPVIVDKFFDVRTFEQMSMDIKRKRAAVVSNASAVMITVIYMGFFSVMNVTFSLPHEALVIAKEKRNQWYSSTSYFVARTIVDCSILSLLITAFCIGSYSHLGQGFDDLWRFALYTLSMYMSGIIAQTCGVILSFLFAENPMTAIFLGPMPVMLMEIVSGLFVRLTDLSGPFVVLSLASFERWSFEGTMTAVYGHGQCGDDLRETFEKGHSLLKNWMAMIFEASRAGAGMSNQLVSSGHHGQHGHHGHHDHHYEEGPAAKFAESIVSNVLSPFVGMDGEVRSIGMTRYLLRDEDSGLAHAYLALIVFCIRGLAYFVVLRKLNQRM